MLLLVWQIHFHLFHPKQRPKLCEWLNHLWKNLKTVKFSIQRGPNRWVSLSLLGSQTQSIIITTPFVMFNTIFQNNCFLLPWPPIMKESGAWNLLTEPSKEPWYLPFQNNQACPLARGALGKYSPSTIWNPCISASLEAVFFLSHHHKAPNNKTQSKVSTEEKLQNKMFNNPS